MLFLALVGQLSRTINRAGQHALSWLAFGSARFVLGTNHRVQHKALLFVALGLLTPACWSATPPNTPVTNTATATYQISGSPLTSTGSVTVTTAASTQGSIELLQYVAGGSGGTLVQVNATQCGGAILPAPTYIFPPATTIPVPGLVRLQPVTTYRKGEPIFVKVTDYDQNHNPTLVETVTKTITSQTGDTETLTLSETGVSTGVFVGYIMSTAAATVANNCLLSVASGQTVQGTYTDPLDNIPTVSARALVDPFGTVFDSDSGLGVNGATVTIIDVATGLPATVLCDDVVTVLPQPVTTGAPTICDTSVPTGGFRFPLMSPGSYRLEVTPPTDYSFPSTVPVADLPGTYIILGVPGNGGSYGDPFVLPLGPALRVDVPIDPSPGDLQISKSSTKVVAAVGEYIPYTITIKNNKAAPAPKVEIADHLPLGFRYVADSARLDGVVLPNPVISSDGRTLTFSLGSIAASATVTLKYVAVVTAGAAPGKAENTAAATAGTTSNTASATITIIEDLMHSRAILMGRVIVGSCDGRVDNDQIGLANARIVLEDGTYILTDIQGRWHAENIRPGTHVVQLDLESVPADMEVLACEKNSRMAASGYSQLVNVRGGSLWRADFHVQKKRQDPDASTTTSSVITPAATTAAATTTNTPTPVATIAAATSARDTKTADPAGNSDADSMVEQLPYDASWLAQAQPGTEWLHPLESFQPALPVIKVVVKHAPGEKLQLRLNGTDVSTLNFEGTLVNTAGTLALSSWRGVALRDGNNQLELLVTDASGKQVLQQSRRIHYSSGPDRFIFLPEQSHLIADGKTRPVIAVRFLDRDGYPVRRGVSAEFGLNDPYESAAQLDAIQHDPLAGRVNNRPRFEIGRDGVALIELAPTTQSGEALLKFTFNDTREHELRAWLEPGQRDWILVGVAEGVIGNKHISGDKQAFASTGDDAQLFDGNRVAFYAKGTIKGNYLLTMAYDTSKHQGDGGSNLKQTIDPNRYYTLYADATRPYFDAASESKLYLKIERSQFYALFGDYDTGLTVTEFSRYSRTVNGLKSEYRGEKFGYNAFATMTKQAYIKDEIPGDGTSGLYTLSSGNIVENSDKIRIETRDRFQSQNILNVQTLTRYLDYDLDVNKGTLFFRAPVLSHDINFNPIYIIAEYESSNSRDEKLSYGGRASYKPNANSEIGATVIHDGTQGATGNLTGLDATIQLDEKTRVQAELAHSNQNLDSGNLSGDAWKVEVTRHDENLDAKAYIRQQGEGFGLGQQAGSETDTRKFGVEARMRLSDNLLLQGQAYRQDTLSTGAQRDVVEARVDQKFDRLSSYYGVLYARDDDGAGEIRQSEQLLAGVAYQTLNKKLILHAGTELGLSSSDNSSDFPNRVVLGADYALSENTKLLAEQEFAQGSDTRTNMTRVGLRTRPWSGGELAASLGNQASLDSGRLFANLGLVQRWQINPHWQTDFAVDQSQTLSGTVTQLNDNVPPASGSIAGDYTAASAGLSFNDGVWGAAGRIERRVSDIDDKTNFLIGAQRNLDDGQVLAAGFLYADTQSDSGPSRKIDGRLSYAYRPWDSQWVWLNRVDYVEELISDLSSQTHTRKLVNNTNVNWMPDSRTQLAFQYGAKYVFDNIDGTGYSGYTDLLGFELRHDLSAVWDIGAHASMLHSWSASVKNFGLGASVGYKLLDNTWIAVGYNLMGFDDADFTGAEYRAQGAYIAIRLRIDQDTLKLNDSDARLTSRKH